MDEFNFDTLISLRNKLKEVGADIVLGDVNGVPSFVLQVDKNKLPDNDTGNDEDSLEN